MIDFGTVKPGTTLRIPFSSFAGSTGASVTLTGLATTDIEVYKDGSTTQRASDNGYALLDTDGIDFDGITGIHGFSIDLADNTTAGFWAAGSQYTVVVSAVTIDSQTVNFIAATFRIGHEAAVLNTTIATLSSQTSFTLTNGPAEDDALNGCIVCIHDVASAVQQGFAVVSDYTGSTRTVTLTAGTTFTAAASDNVSFFPPSNAAYGGGVAYTATRGLAGTALPAAAADAAGGLIVSDAGGLDADAMRSDVAAILVDTGTTLDGKLDTIDNFLDTEIAAIISTLGTPAGASVSADIAVIEAQTDDIGTAGAGLTAIPWNASWDAEVQSEVQDALVANNLDHLLVSAVDTDFATTVHLNSVIGHLVDNGTSATFDRTTDSLEALQAEDDATQVLVAASAIRAAIGLASANLDTQLSTIDDFLDTEVAAILAAVDTEVASIISTLGTPAGASISADILTLDNLVDDLESRVGTPSNLGSGATVAANLVDIEGQTDDIGSAGAGLTALATAAELAKVPKSDGTATWNATALASLQQEATDALNAYDPPTNAEMEARTLVAANYATASALDAVDNFVDTEIAAIQTTLAALFTTALTESYRSDGSAGSVAQLLYEINQMLGERAIVGVTGTVKKIDGSTTAFTQTFNDASTPTSVTRAT